MNEYTSAFVRVSRGVPGVIYRPVQKSDKKTVGILVMHSDADYLDHSAGRELSGRGYTVLCANVGRSEGLFSRKIEDVSAAVSFLKNESGIRKIIVMGHSGGATLMSAYQAAAENGVSIFQGNEMLMKMPDLKGELYPADGFISIDSNWGNGAMRLFSMDPAVVIDNGALTIIPELDAFSEENGWSPEGAHYSEEFLKRFFKAQHEMNMRLTEHALERISLIEKGKGIFSDDEPLFIPTASQIAFNNKLFAQDTRLLSHTLKPQYLYHKDGLVTNETVYSVRRPRMLKPVRETSAGWYNTTVRNFISNTGVATDDSYHYDEQEVFGVRFETAPTCTPGNIRFINVPTIILGMTASWEYAAAETIYNNSPAKDKYLAYIDGAGHNFETLKECERYEGEFGDTMKTTYDLLDSWICKRFL